MQLTELCLLKDTLDLKHLGISQFLFWAMIKCQFLKFAHFSLHLLIFGYYVSRSFDVRSKSVQHGPTLARFRPSIDLILLGWLSRLACYNRYIDGSRAVPLSMVFHGLNWIASARWKSELGSSRLAADCANHFTMHIHIYTSFLNLSYNHNKNQRFCWIR